MPQGPPSAAGARSPSAARPDRPDASTTRSASRGEPSTTRPWARPSVHRTPSTCPCCTVRPLTRSALVRSARSKVSRRDRWPAGTTPMPGTSNVTGSAPDSSHASRAAGHSSRSAKPTCVRNACAWWNCMTPARAHPPCGGGEVSRSPATTSWPRPARAAPRNSPAGPAPMTATRMAARVFLSGRPRQRSWASVSVHRLGPAQAHLLDVELGLEVTQHDVVDPLLVAQSDHGGALPGEQGEPQLRVLLLMPAHRLVLVLAGRGQDAEVLFVLLARPLDDVRVGAEV